MTLRLKRSELPFESKIKVRRYFGLENRNQAFNFFSSVLFTKKQRASPRSLQSPGLKNILQFGGNRPEIGQYHIARKAVWATFTVLK